MDEFIEVPGARFRIRSGGSGPILLLLGGAAEGGGLGVLRDLLEPSYTVITYDRRGLGESTVDAPDAPVEVADDADDAAAVLAAITPEPAYVASTSNGAVQALELALRHPNRIRTLLAHEPPLPHLLPPPQRDQITTTQSQITTHLQTATPTTATPLLSTLTGLPTPPKSLATPAPPPPTTPTPADPAPEAPIAPVPAVPAPAAPALAGPTVAESTPAGPTPEAPVAPVLAVPAPAAPALAGPTVAGPLPAGLPPEGPVAPAVDGSGGSMDEVRAAFLRRVALPLHRYRPDRDALATCPVSIVIGAGEEAPTLVGPLSATALAALRRTAVTVFPGGHAGYLQKPAEFTAILRTVLPPT
ncbi:alpha/beta fold hydrolase [Kribbella sp. CA-245084]|uniref:alpha/beta fold hydrolase n=1 Tax=Kribbella sp. CA-245084 TaxID=3239940 RepID=UPI003D91103F